MKRETAIAQEITLPRIMGAKDVAKYLGVSYYTVITWAEKGKLPGFKAPGGKAWKFRADDIDNWTREQQELEKLKRVPFSRKFDMFRGMIRQSMKQSGYTQEDIPDLIRKTREERRKIH